MNTLVGMDQCLSFINCQLQPPGRRSSTNRFGVQRRAITLSRQAGSGGRGIAQTLLQLLQARTPKDARPWTVFDRNLVEKVLQDHHLPDRLARFMPEDRISEFGDTVDELLGLHPPSWTLVKQTAETILRLAELGNVILIGRGAGIITANLDYVLHVRLIGSIEKRARHLQEIHHLDPNAARRLLAQEDLGRKRYLKKYFGKEIDDPLLYHLVINTDFIPCEEAAHLIANAVSPALVPP